MLGRKKKAADERAPLYRSPYEPRTVGVPDFTPIRFAVKASDGRYLIQATHFTNGMLYTSGERVFVWVDDLEKVELRERSSAQALADQFPPGSVKLVQVLRHEIGS